MGNRASSLLGSCCSYEQLSETRLDIEREEIDRLKRIVSLDEEARAAFSAAAASPDDKVARKKRNAAGKRVVRATTPVPFFNRAAEVDSLLKWVATSPSVPMVILGPQYVGKSRLLTQVGEICQKHMPVLRIDLRCVTVSNPDRLAEELKLQLRNWVDVTFDMLGSAQALVRACGCLSWFSAALPLLQVIGNQVTRTTGFNSLLTCLRQYVHKVEVVVVFDHVEVLEAWEQQYSSDLMELFRFWTWLSAETRTHIFLASTDAFFQRHLCKRGYKSFGLGNFSKDDAETFFTGYCFLGRMLDVMLPPCEWNDVPPCEWDDVYKIAGGSPGQLIELPKTLARKDRHWDAAIESMATDALDILQEEVEAFVQEIKTSDAEDYVKVAMEKMLAEEGVVQYNDMLREVCKPGRSSREAKEVLEAMARHHIFHLQRFNEDVPYKDILSTTIATAAATATTACAASVSVAAGAATATTTPVATINDQVDRKFFMPFYPAQLDAMRRMRGR